MMMRRIEGVGEHSAWFMGLGVVYIIAGVLALIFPFVASGIAALVLGWMLVVVGVATLVQAWQTGTWGGVAWQVIIGAIILIGGIGAVIDPISAAIGLTLLIGVMFLAKGISQIIMGLNLRPLRVWTWVFGAGVLAAVVGLLIILQWPQSGIWTLGTLAGISLIFSGWTYVMMATAARRMVAM
jgi:uncharacterized membrane protein HdeD (DUF308 family)